MTIVKILSSSFLFFQLVGSMPLCNKNSSKNIHFNSSFTMTSSEDTAIDFPIACTRLRSLILKKHMSTIYAQLSQEKKADPYLTLMIRSNMFQIFQINKINFLQYLKLHKHPDTSTRTCDVMTQSDYTTIKPRPFSRSLSNRRRTSLEKISIFSATGR